MSKAPDVPPPSYQRWCLRLKEEEPAEIKCAQEGARAAYLFTFNAHAPRGIWDSSGDYPFANAMIDRTLLSVDFISALTGKSIGKPWISQLKDSCTRAVLAKYLHFDGPCTARIMMVLRECIRRHGRHPFGIASDNGKEFHSTFWQTFLGGHCIIQVLRAAHDPRSGGLLEKELKEFGVLEEEYVSLLQGCTNILKTPQIATKSVLPAQFAIWTILDASAELDRFFDLHNSKVHGYLGISPAEAMTIFAKKSGIDHLPTIPFDNDLLLQTMPEVPDGGYLTVQRPCIVEFRDIRYFAEELATYIGERVLVRLDPMDVGRVLVYLPSGAVQAESQHAEVTRKLPGYSTPRCWHAVPVLPRAS